MLTQYDTASAIQTLRTERLLRTTSGYIKPPVTLDNEDWPPDYDAIRAWRSQKIDSFELNPQEINDARLFYGRDATGCIAFINHWCDTYDPRNAGTDKPVRMPLILFRRQEELVQFVMACVMAEASGQIEKSRDMGATWVCAAISVWMWLFWPASAVGWGSNKQEKVDRIGDPDSVLEKIRLLIRWLPEALRPPEVLDGDYMKQYVCRHPLTGATIRGEIGSNIGRGGRTRLYFVDEAAHLDHPEAVEASLSENTRVRMDISSVSGLGTIFHRAREAGVDWELGMAVQHEKTNVFVMDWRHHPEKTEEWHTKRKKHFESRGLSHVFAREIERNYSASVEGIIIPYEWVESAVDAHIKLNFDDEGAWSAGLDVADEGLDSNALIRIKGSVIKYAEEWGERDVGATARRAIVACRNSVPVELQYDCNGVGAGVKSEANRLKDDGVIPAGITLIPWSAGARILDPGGRVIENDPDSPKNKDFYTNLKSQGWWNARQRFYNTHQAITEGLKFDPVDMISLDSSTLGPIINKLKKELAQATITKDSRLKLLVNKSPEGTSSPNLADACIMAIWPWRGPEEMQVSMFGPKVIRG